MQRVLVSIAVSLLAVSAWAEQIAVGNYGVSANGMPFGVALVKGYFKEEGLDVTGLISSAGGGTSLRNMLAGGGVPYGEVNPGVVVNAILQGADLRIVSDNVLTVAEFVWAVKPDSPIKSIKDFKGKKIGYTNPRSTSQALARMLLQAGGYTEADAELVKTGGFGEGIAALESGQIDIAPITEPLWSKVKSKFRAVVVANDVLPPLDNVVGVATLEMMEKRGDFIRGVIRARRKAVQFILFPAAVPEIFTGLRVGFSLTLIGTLLAEMFASQRGLGYLLMTGIGLHNVEEILSVTLLIVVFAAVVSVLLLHIDHRLHRGAAMASE